MATSEPILRKHRVGFSRQVYAPREIYANKSMVGDILSREPLACPELEAGLVTVQVIHDDGHVVLRDAAPGWCQCLVRPIGC